MTAPILQMIGLVAGLLGGLLLATAQQPMPDNIHGKIVMLRRPRSWRWGFWLLFAGFALQALGMLAGRGWLNCIK